MNDPVFRYGSLLALLLTGCNGDSGETPQLQDSESLLKQETTITEYSYSCEDGSRLEARFEAAGDEMIVFLSDRAVRMSHVHSASGAKYSAGDLIFWSKGDSALLQRGDEAMLECRQLDE